MNIVGQLEAQQAKQKPPALRPGAPHPVLLHLSKLAVPLHLAPGSAFPRPDAGTGLVYLVSSGEMSAQVRGEVIRFTSGSMIDLQASQSAPVAGGQGAELLGLPREEIIPLLPGADQTARTGAAKREHDRPWLSWLRRKKGTP